jgi:HTH-type transcriptional regulator, competence development regulator
MSNIETLGETIRRLREAKEMPLRKLAAALDIDQSTLSKIERNERNANDEMIRLVATLFDVDYKELKIKLLSDKIAYNLLGEDLGKEVLAVAEEKLEYFRKKEGK